MRLNKSITQVAASVLLATLSSAPVLANQAGDIIVRAGITHVAPASNDSAIYANSAPLGATASVEDDSQLGLNFVYFYSDKVAVELLAATPFSHDISISDGTDAANLGSTKHLPPTLSVLYYPNEPSSKWQPYLGAGINYTVFFDDKFNPAQTDSALNLENLNLKNSWGLSAQLGLDYHLEDNWLVNASVRYIDIDTTATFTAVNGTVPGKVDVEIDPWVYTLSLGYKF